MNFLDRIKSWMEKKSFREPIALLLLGVLVVSAFDLSWYIEAPILSVWLLWNLNRIMSVDNIAHDQVLRKALYHLVMELDVGLINLSKVSPLDAIQKVTDKMRDRNLKQSRYRENLFKQLDLAIIEFTQNMKVKRSTLSESVKKVLGANNLNSEGVVPFLYGKSDMSAEELRSIEFHFTSVLGMGEMQWKLSSSNFPSEISCKSNGKRSTLKLRYIPIFEGDALQSISIVIQDVTEYKKMQSDAAQKEKEIEKIFALLEVSDNLFDMFMDETRDLFESIKDDLKKIRSSDTENGKIIAARMFRHVHTIKANSKLFKLHSIQDVAHEVEDYLSDLRNDKIAFEKSAFMELTQKVMAISEEIYSYASLRKEMLGTIGRQKDHGLRFRVQWIRSLLNQFANILRDPHYEQRNLKPIQQELDRALSSFDQVSIREYTKDYDKMIDELCDQLDKKMKTLVTKIDHPYFEANVLGRLNDIIVHCIRNSVDHGIESPAQRVKLGKDESGEIKISITDDQSNVIIIIEDDGAGIDPEKIKSKAVEKEIISADAAASISEQEAFDLIFHPGFSTAEKVSEISGRGLGMDAIKDAVGQLNGWISLNSKMGEGTQIKIEFPSDFPGLLSPYTIYRVEDVIKDSVLEYRDQDRFQVKDNFTETQTLVFGDQWEIRTYLSELFLALHQQNENNIDFEVCIESHMGRRQLDSYQFYRIKMIFKNSEPEMLQSFKKLDTVIRIEEQMKSIGGSLLVRDSDILELNVPSNIPVEFSSFVFNILVISGEQSAFRTKVENFFDQVLGGWDHQIQMLDSADSFELKNPKEAFIAIVDSEYVTEYANLRNTHDRKLDSILLLTDEMTDLGILSELDLSPQNIIFAPKQGTATFFDRALSSIILRRFLADMMGARHLELKKNAS